MTKYYVPSIEEWRDVIGYEKQYEVSNFGNIRRKIKNLQQGKNVDGYNNVTLCKNGVCKTEIVHRVVAKAFLDNPDNKPQIHHRNFIKTDNSISNLEWTTAEENCQYNVEKGILRNQNGENNNMSKITEKDVLFIRELLNSGVTAYQVHKEYYPFLHQQTIYAIKIRRIWKNI